jgi:hypothetical protein
VDLVAHIIMLAVACLPSLILQPLVKLQGQLTHHHHAADPRSAVVVRLACLGVLFMAGCVGVMQRLMQPAFCPRLAELVAAACMYLQAGGMNRDRLFLVPV